MYYVKTKDERKDEKIWQGVSIAPDEIVILLY
jgi:hypothetical protein